MMEKIGCLHGKENRVNLRPDKNQLKQSAYMIEISIFI